MSDIELWKLVRDWVHARYKRVRVVEFPNKPSSVNLTKMGLIVLSSDENEEVGFIATKGLLVWTRKLTSGSKRRAANEFFGLKDKKRQAYILLLATDPEMFEKLDELLRPYESKRSK